MIFSAIKTLLGLNPIPSKVWNAMPESLKVKIGEARSRKAKIYYEPDKIIIVWCSAPLAMNAEFFDPKTGNCIDRMIS